MKRKPEAKSCRFNEFILFKVSWKEFRLPRWFKGQNARSQFSLWVEEGAANTDRRNKTHLLTLCLLLSWPSEQPFWKWQPWNPGCFPEPLHLPLLDLDQPSPVSSSPGGWSVTHSRTPTPFLLSPKCPLSWIFQGTSLSLHLALTYTTLSLYLLFSDKKILPGIMGKAVFTEWALCALFQASPRTSSFHPDKNPMG